MSATAITGTVCSNFVSNVMTVQLLGIPQRSARRLPLSACSTAYYQRRRGANLSKTIATVDKFRKFRAALLSRYGFPGIPANLQCRMATRKLFLLLLSGATIYKRI